MSRRSSLRVVPLEDRSVPAAFVVTTTADVDPTGFDPATGTLPSGVVTLRSAVLAANALAGADTIAVPAGTYALTLAGAGEDAGQTGDLDVTGDVAFTFAAGAVVDAAGLNDRVLDVRANALGMVPTVAITGGTFRNGNLVAAALDDAEGGGIRSSGSLTLNDVTVTGNRATGGGGATLASAGSAFGGGVWAAGTLAVNNSTIAGNTATGGTGALNFPAGDGRGGGLFVRNASVQLAGVRVTGNVAAGGVSSGSNEGTLDGDAFGGGVSAVNAALTVTDSRIDTNQARGGDAVGGDGAGGGDARGGGLSASDSTLNLNRTTVDANLARGGLGPSTATGAAAGGDAFGGGVAIDGGFSISFDLGNVTLSGNAARGGDGAAGGGNAAFQGVGLGGGLYVTGFGTATGFIAYATVTDNEAAAGAGDDVVVTEGGGVYLDAGFGTVDVGRSVVAGNRAGQKPDAAVESGSIDYTSDGANVVGVGVGDGTAAFVNGVNGDQVGTAAAPLNALLTPLGFFGGSPRNLVHALNPGSPARDADPNTLVSIDQRGFDRGVNGKSDAGAFEVQFPTTVTQVVNGPLVAGQPFTVTAAVTDPRFPPTGGVQLFVNGVAAGTGTLDAAGNATLAGTAPASGPATISFAYAGDAAYFPATSTTAAVPVLAASTTTVVPTPSPAVEGQPITVTATVTASDGSTPTGNVTFLLDGTPFSGPTALDAAGSATAALPAGLPAGTYTFAVQYAGSPAVAGSSGSAPLRVQAATTTAVTVSPNPAFPTQPLTLTATLSSANATPTGSVTFRIDGSPVGTVAVAADGTATLPTAGRPTGTYAVTADYTPTGFFLPSAAPPATLTVVSVPTTSTVTAAPGPAFPSQPLTLTAAVMAAFGTPAGDVTFRVNGTAVGTATLDAGGNATLQLPAGLPTGTYTITVEYPGDTIRSASSSPPVTLTVNPSPTATTLTVAPNSPVAGTPLTLTADVTATFGTPTGTVNFLVNGAVVGSAAVDAAGRAVLSLPAGLAAGGYTLRAEYAGVPRVFDPSASPNQTVVLAQIPTATTVTATPTPVLATDPFTLTATVTSPSGPPTAGTVTFFLDGAFLGTVPLDGPGRATFPVPAGVPVGDGRYTLGATYTGAGDFSSSFAPLGSLTVNPVPTRTTLTPSPTTAVQGTAVTLTAEVAFAPNTTPQRRENRTAALDPAILSGRVDFFAGPTPLGSAAVSNGVAVLTVTSLPVGANAVSAVFVPATNDLSGSTGAAAVTIAARPAAVREIFAVGTGYGDITVVKVYDADGTEITSFRPFGDDYWCGAVVATADVTGDGVEDVLVTAPLGAGPRVKIYDGRAFTVVADFYAYEPSFYGGSSLAAGDLTGDGVAEFVTGAGPGGGPLVKVYSFANGVVQLLNGFFAYDPALRSGVNVAVSGGLLATGPGYTGGPQVNVYSGPGTRRVTSFFAFDAASRDGVNVSLAFDGTRTILTAGSGAGELPVVRTFDATTGERFASRPVFEPNFLGGVTVTTVRSAAGELRTVVGTGLGGGPRVRILGPGDAVVNDFFAVNADFRGGVFVG